MKRTQRFPKRTVADVLNDANTVPGLVLDGKSLVLEVLEVLDLHRQYNTSNTNACPAVDMRKQKIQCI